MLDRMRILPLRLSKKPVLKPVLKRSRSTSSAIASVLLPGLLTGLLSGCAGNAAIQNALKSDSRFLKASPVPSQIASVTPEVPASASPVSPGSSNAPIVSSTPSTPSTSSTSPVISPSVVASASGWRDLDQVQPALRPYVDDLLQLNLLQPPADAKESLRWSDPISRRTFAKWLWSINNQFYANSPNQQIRTAIADSKPVFQDISNRDRDFVILQGLAEAGIVPSALSGAEGSDRFEPERSLKREELLQWKVPLDIQGSLPRATIADVQKTWAFQDGEKIDPSALAAVYQDYQNGDAANLRRIFGYTTLLQPQKAVTYAEAAAALWSIGSQRDRLTARDRLKMN